MKKKAIIFDLDGTLWDSTEGLVDLWNRVVAEKSDLKIHLSREEIAAQMGKPMYDIAASLFPTLPKEEQMYLIDECGYAENDYFWEHGAKLYDHLEETLQILKKDYDLYIVSNCQDGYIEAFMHAHKLEDYFLDIESGRTGLVKLDNIKLIMERNGIKDAVYVGDTTGDKDSSEGAGIPFIYAAYGLGTVKECDYKIETFAELPELMKSVR